MNYPGYKMTDAEHIVWCYAERMKWFYEDFKHRNLTLFDVPNIRERRRAVARHSIKRAKYYRDLIVGYVAKAGGGP